MERIIFEGYRAVGVQLASPNETMWADTVVLSAGTYNSPAILMRSGLGPGRHLREHNIRVLEDAPGVGANLADHPLVTLRFAAPLDAYIEDCPGFQTLLTLKSDEDMQDYDLHIFPRSIFPSEPEDSAGQAQFSLFVGLMKPQSRGQLRLRSSAADASPVIDCGYFTYTGDVQRMLKGVKAARQLARSDAMKELALQELYPGSQVHDSDASMEAAIRAGVESYHHPVGTCRMGPSTDNMAVVDKRGKVHGVEGLWIVDASIMPTIPAANTNLPTILIAERCAAWLNIR